MTIMPIPLLYYIDGHRYFGYINSNVLHNPTVLLLKPFAIIVILELDKLLKNQIKGFKRISISLFVILSCLVKPNFGFSILPAAIIYSLIFRRNQFSNIFIYLVIPVSITLLIQYVYTNLNGLHTSKLICAPMEVYKIYSQGWTLIPKLIISISLPLLISFINFRDAIRSEVILICWINLLIATMEMIIFAERPEPRSANLFWGPQIALFLLNLFSFKLFLEKFTLSACNVFVILLSIIGVYSGLQYWLETFNNAPNW
jgi:hypothetical protein